MEKRIVYAYILTLALMTGLMVRLAVLSQGEEFRTAAAVQSSYGLEVGESRGTIYDRNLKPLVNNSSQLLLAVAPTPEAVTALREQLPAEEFQEDLPLLENGKPVVVPASIPVSGQGIECFRLPVRNSQQQLAPHVIGYVDGSGTGVCGVEAGYDQLLESWGGEVETHYLINAFGGALTGGAVQVTDTRPEEQGGVVLTLDRKIQQLAEQAGEEIPAGAVVVMDPDTGEILAMASFPDYSPVDVASALEGENSPLFNRATASYSVGSTFKICVAAAALEMGFTPEYEYVCPGYYDLGEQRYYCHQRSGHWQLAMARALRQSCNPYFINLGQQIGAARLYQMASDMGFGSAVKLVEGVVAATGTLPLPEEIDLGELANLSFGQGKLTATPVQVTQMMASVANGGMAVRPTLFAGITEDGATIERPTQQEPRRIMSAQTAQQLLELLGGVVTEEGSGRQAAPQFGQAAGKTASAQTGSYVDGKEVVHGWFTGAWPLEDPRYVITVLVEGGESGGELPAQVFRKITEGLALLEDQHLYQDVTGEVILP